MIGVTAIGERAVVWGQAQAGVFDLGSYNFKMQWQEKP